MCSGLDRTELLACFVRISEDEGGNAPVGRMQVVIKGRNNGVVAVLSADLVADSFLGCKR